MASSKISELVDGNNFEPGDETIIVRNGANFKVDTTINAVNAWVNFNGTGTVAIRASYNVSSITDNGTGDYTVNFTNALTDAEYSKCVATSPAYGSQITTVMTDVQSSGLTEVAPTSSSFRFLVSHASSATRADPKYASVIVVR
jgi:hypothetical protein